MAFLDNLPPYDYPQVITSSLVVPSGWEANPLRQALFFTLVSLIACTTIGMTAVRDKAAQAPHWSLQARSHPAVPQFTAAADRQWITNRIDAFILAGLQKNNGSLKS